ncbi:hypothetical protein CEXT_465261 [Caerostris extrusa]|uniref:Uncharacterized protein n=1 Tax=Caerostris extrusa TaxID=172846 RepID=A0AAV4P9Q7_CAEEX|nr:hypothetical protein CEXT_465261 [Caerostris extrusa]
MAAGTNSLPRGNGTGTESPKENKRRAQPGPTGHTLSCCPIKQQEENEKRQSFSENRGIMCRQIARTKQTIVSVRLFFPVTEFCHLPPPQHCVSLSGGVEGGCLYEIGNDRNRSVTATR